GMLTVFVPAVTPVPPLPLKVFVITAGALRTSRGKFVAVIVLARSIRFFGEVYLGLLLGKDAQGFLTRNGWTLGGLVIALACAFYLVVRWVECRRQPAVGPFPCVYAEKDRHCGGRGRTGRPARLQP